MTNRPVSPRGRAAFLLARLSRDLSDNARDLVADIATPHRPGELVRRVRHQLRLPTIPAVDLAVILEAVDGTPWDVLADELCMDADEVRRRYEPTVQMWLAGFPTGPEGAAIYGPAVPALREDHDPAGTAAALDEWVARTDDPRYEREPAPVTRALNT